MWTFPFPSPFFIPATFQIFTLASPAPPEQHSSPQYSSTASKENLQNRKNLLHISEEDLIKAGYESKKIIWSEEEDIELRRLRDQEKLEWSKIAELMTGRNSKMCYSRYRRLENHTKEIWRKADDELLLQLVEQLGEDWKQISKQFEKRTHKQIKEHFNNYLKDGIRRQDWTLEEDLKLVDLLNKHGREWKLIERLFEGRTQNQIKNRYFGRLKRISEKNLQQRERSRLEDKKRQSASSS